MKHTSHTLLFFLFISIISAPVFSQNVEPSVKTKESSRTDGLKKLKSTQHDRNIAEAMWSVEVALDKLEITIEPIEIRLENLSMDMNPVVVDIPT